MASDLLVDEFLRTRATIDRWTVRKEELIRQPEKWGPINFEDIEQELETVFWLVETIKDLPLRIIPDEDLGPALQSLQNIVIDLEDIGNFQISGDAQASRNQLAGKLARHVENVMRSLGVWLPFLVLRSGAIENWAGKMENEFQKAAVMLKQQLDAAENRLAQIDEALQTARATAGDAGAAVFTQEFDNETKAARNRSWWWLATTIIFVIAALTMPILVIIGELGTPPTATLEAVYMTGWRVIAIGVLFYAAAWSGRVVLANMNLASVNKHRAISLRTLQAFHKAANDPAAKDAVVLEAARAVYENVPTGYIPRQVSQHGASARTLEIIKNANRGSSDA